MSMESNMISLDLSPQSVDPEWIVRYSHYPAEEELQRSSDSENFISRQTDKGVSD
jgi:hypothetical protein